MSSSPRSPPGSWGHWSPTVATGGCQQACHNGRQPEKAEDFLPPARPDRARSVPGVAPPVASPCHPLSGFGNPSLGAWQPLATLRAGITGRLAIGCESLRTVHDGTIAAWVVHPVAQPRSRSGTPSMRPRSLRTTQNEVPGALDHRRTTKARARHDSRIGRPQRSPRGELDRSPRGRRHVVVRAARRRAGPSARRGLATAVTYSAIAADAVRRLARQPMRAQQDQPDNRDAASHLHRHPEAAKTPDALTRMAERQPQEPPKPGHTLVSALRAIRPLARWRVLRLSALLGQPLPVLRGQLRRLSLRHQGAQRVQNSDARCGRHFAPSSRHGAWPRPEADAPLQRQPRTR